VAHWQDTTLQNKRQAVSCPELSSKLQCQLLLIMVKAIETLNTSQDFDDTLK
jgi:hypothetical protein